MIERFVDWFEHLPALAKVIAGVAVTVFSGALGAGIYIGSLNSEVETLKRTKAPIEQVAVLQNDVGTIKNVALSTERQVGALAVQAAELSGLLTGMKTELELRAKLADEERGRLYKETDDHEQRIRKLEKPPKP
jgi:hypothetical protein